MAKQNQLEKLIGTGADSRRVLEKTQYDFFRNGVYRIASPPHEHEKLHLQAIELISRKLQKKLYPNPLIRLVHRIKARLYDKPKHLNEVQKSKDESLISLNRRFKDLGLASYSGKLEQFMSHESSHVSIPMTTQIKGKETLDIDVHLTRGKDGQYQFDGYKATIKNQDTGERAQLFHADTSITAMEAVNLLSGRAVKKGYEMADVGIGYKWLQLDLKASTQSGYKVNEYHTGYSIEKEISDLTSLLRFGGMNKTELINSLEQGNRIALQARSPLNEQVFIHASPADHALLILNKDHKPLTIETLAAQKQQANQQDREKSLVLINPQQKEQEQSQALGMG